MNKMIIDFHTHPFLTSEQNILMYKDSFDFTTENFKEVLEGCGITKFCGSVVNPKTKEKENRWEAVLHNNNTAYELRKIYKGAYIPGIHVHPDFIEESKKEIKRAKENGIRLIGELVPYLDGWDYSHSGIHPILDFAEKNEIVHFKCNGKKRTNAGNHKKNFCHMVSAFCHGVHHERLADEPIEKREACDCKGCNEETSCCKRHFLCKTAKLADLTSSCRCDYCTTAHEEYTLVKDIIKSMCSRTDNTYCTADCCRSNDVSKLADNMIGEKSSQIVFNKCH